MSILLLGIYGYGSIVRFQISVTVRLNFELELVIADVVEYDSEFGKLGSGEDDDFVKFMDLVENCGNWFEHKLKMS